MEQSTFRQTLSSSMTRVGYGVYLSLGNWLNMFMRPSARGTVLVQWSVGEPCGASK